MTIAVQRRPTGNVTAKTTAIHFRADDVVVNERYYMTVEATNQPTLRSVVFQGEGEWEGVILPAAASWTAHLRKASDDSSVATSAITAS